jgi:hypothetical protein
VGISFLRCSLAISTFEYFDMATIILPAVSRDTYLYLLGQPLHVSHFLNRSTAMRRKSSGHRRPSPVRHL